MIELRALCELKTRILNPKIWALLSQLSTTLQATGASDLFHTSGIEAHELCNYKTYDKSNFN